MHKVEFDGAILYHADCLDVLPTLSSVDTVVTDPPYELNQKCGVATLYGHRRMQFDFDTAGITESTVIPALRIAFSLAQSYHVFCDAEQFRSIADVARENNMTPKVWAKQKLCTPPPMPGNWWVAGFELACYGYRKNAYFGDTSPNRKNIMVFDSYRSGIRGSEKVDHPTQKWLPMMSYLVSTIVPPSGTALDPFMGSGTTGVACIQHGRKFIGIEKDDKYFSIACKRIEQEVKQRVLWI